VEEQNLDVQNKAEKNQEETPGGKRRDEDHFTNFMFGQRRNLPQRREQEHELNTNQNYIDYEQLMIHLDSFIESTKDFKPLFQKFKPFVEQFWKNK
jgi:hypothetical protein